MPKPKVVDSVVLPHLPAFRIPAYGHTVGGVGKAAIAKTEGGVGQAKSAATSVAKTEGGVGEARREAKTGGGAGDVKGEDVKSEAPTNKRKGDELGDEDVKRVKMETKEEGAVSS
jgi:hypothetical protein